MWWEIAICIAAFAFIVLSVFGILFLHKASGLINDNRAAIQQAQQRLNLTLQQAQQLMQSSTKLLEEIHAKLHTSEKLFSAIEETSDAVHRVSRSVHAVSRSVEQTVEEARKAVHNRQELINDCMVLAASGMQLWQRWQLHRQTKSSTDGTRNHNGQE